MLFDLIIFLIGLIVLSWSADKFVFGASAMAKNIGVSPMLIGMTIVAMGSSAPEIVVSATASFNGNTDTAIGNGLGSNITNIALVLGLTALLKPLLVSSGTLRRELPLLLVVNILAVYFLYDQAYVFHEGLISIILFFGVLALLAWMSFHTEKNDPLQSESEDEIPTGVANSRAIFWVVVGVILLPVSAHYMVDSAVNIARYFGLSDLIIGLTIIALGTSLPELAASIAGVMKNEDDLALGNIIGSNIFNILAVLAMPGLIAPGLIDPDAAGRDMYIMLALTILLFLMCFNLKGTRCINRYEGAFLLACYLLYQYSLFQ